MAISTIAALSNALSSPDQDIPVHISVPASATGSSTNLNRAATWSAFGIAAIPTARTSGGHIPTDNLAGYPGIGEAPAGQTLNLAKAVLACNPPATISIYDRIWAASGFSGADNANNQLVTGFPALPSRAPANGEGLEIWLESYAAIGSTAANVEVVYTNSAGTTLRATMIEPMITSFPVHRMHRLRLQDGDTGVQSIQHLTLYQSSGTVGNFGIVLLKRICMVPFPLAHVPVTLDFAALGLPAIDPSTALQFVYQSTTTTSGSLTGTIHLVVG